MRWSTCRSRWPVGARCGRCRVPWHRLWAAPRRVPVALANALHHLGSAPTGRPAEWIEVMTVIAGRAHDVDELLDAGAVAAWRCGLARLRASALEAAPRLRPELLAIAVGSPTVAELADPWFDPSSSELRVVSRV